MVEVLENQNNLKVVIHRHLLKVIQVILVHHPKIKINNLKILMPQKKRLRKEVDHQSPKFYIKFKILNKITQSLKVLN